MKRQKIKKYQKPQATAVNNSFGFIILDVCYAPMQAATNNDLSASNS